jgi:putative ABC transport system permease protein
MERVVGDLRHAVRALGRSPGVVLVVVLTLGLGIGANTAIFSVANALLLRLLPVPAVDQVVALDAMHDGEPGGVGPDDFDDWQTSATVFQRMAYTGFAQAVLTGQGFPGFAEPERLTGATVSAGFFELLGVRPALGRWFLPDEQEPARSDVVILSDELWRHRFGAREDIVGRTLELDGSGYAVVGVMPAGFRFNEGRPVQYWVPVAQEASGRGVHQYSAYARLKPGVTLASARLQMHAIAERLQRLYPATNAGWDVAVTPLRDELLGGLRPAILIFFAAVGVVLLIACVNVASLLLARSVARRRELTVRRALGASRLAIAGLLLAESLLLAVVAAVVGLVLAVWGVRLAATLAPAWLDLGSIAYVDDHVLGFATALALLTGLLTGLVPAWQASRAELSEQLRQTGAAGRGVRHSRTLAGLVVAEVALATVLLVSVGLLLRSFVRVLDVDLGFRDRNVLTVRLQLPVDRYPGDAEWAAFYQRLLRRVRSLPGVVSAGAVDAIPLGGRYSGGPIDIQGRAPPREPSLQQAAYREATPGYFRTLGIPLLAGRLLEDRDRAGSDRVVLVNQALARRYFPTGALGGRVRPAGDTIWCTVVGVVGDVRHDSPERAEGPALYFPQAQMPASHMFLAVHTSVPAASLGAAVRGEIRALDPALVPLQVRTMAQAVSSALGPRREILALMAFFAAVALGLAALGLGGVMWYGVTQRTREIGVRLALGAEPGHVLLLVVRRGLGLTLAGLALGLIAALAFSRLLASLLYGVGARDAIVFVAAPVVIAAAALVANYMPARRAAAVDPVVALRSE